MTKEEIKDELYRMLSDVVNGGYPKRNNTQKGRYRKAVEKAIEALEQEPCADAISREKTMQIVRKWFDRDAAPSDLKNEIEQLPPVTPQYTEAEIQKMQDLEFAEIQKAYELGKAEGVEVLEEIRAEIDSYCSDNRDRNDGLCIAMMIIDKYKASPTREEVEE